MIYDGNDKDLRMIEIEWNQLITLFKQMINTVWRCIIVTKWSYKELDKSNIVKNKMIKIYNLKLLKE